MSRLVPVRPSTDRTSISCGSMDGYPATLRAPSPWFLTSPPQTTAGTIARTRLLSLLSDSLATSQVTLLAAPSGYGKTVLLAEWASHHPSTTAWLTLTPHDHGDDTLVLSGILSAMRRLAELAPDAAVRGMPAPDADARAIIGRIAETMGALDETIVVVIDDAHHAGPSLAGGVVDVLTALTAGRLRFALAGTPELSSWFSRSLVSREAAVLTGADLALTAADIAQDAPSAIDEADAEALLDATGGWPIAVQLRRLAGHAGPALIGSDVLLTDYIAGNVLPRLRPDLERFVLATSVCSRLTPALARALSGVDESESLLEECIAQGLFLDRYLDPDGARVYRWHDEFAARCREILTRASGARRRALEVIAARWMAPYYPAEAVGHALRADEPALAIDIIRSSWLRVIVDDGAKALRTLCVALPPHLAEHPEILLIRACCLDQLDDRTGAALLASKAATLGALAPAHEATNAFAALFLAHEHTALSAAADSARAVLERGDIPASMQAYSLFLLGWAELRLRRDPPRAVRLLESAKQEAIATRRAVLARRASTNLLFSLSYGGSLSAARRLIEDHRARDDDADDWQYYDGGIELFARAFTDYWQDRMADAEAGFGVLVAEGGHDASYTALARVYLAFCAAREGSPAALSAARKLISRVSTRETRGVPWPAYRSIANAALLASAGDFDRAMTAIEPLRPLKNIPGVRIEAAEIARRAGRIADATELLAALTAPELSISYVAASARVTAALIADERGDPRQAHRRIESALDAGAADGVVLPFSRNDGRLRELLVRHAATGTAHEAFLAARVAEDDRRAPAALDLGTMLSAREWEIYAYLGTTMTAIEIGAALFVSVNTIRTHQRSIYRKLGVANRREAVRLRLREGITARAAAP